MHTCVLAVVFLACEQLLLNSHIEHLGVGAPVPWECKTQRVCSVIEEMFGPVSLLPFEVFVGQG